MRRNPDYSDEEEARGELAKATLERYADTIRAGMAEMLWTLAYAAWAEEDENHDEADEQLGRAKAGEDWMDRAQAKGTPKAAEKAAKDLYELYEKANGNMVDLFGLAEEADMGEPFSFYEDGPGDSKDKRLEQQWKLGDAGDFGQGFAALAMDQGFGWFDNHKEFSYEKVRFECTYDGDELTWRWVGDRDFRGGGSADVREVSGRIGRIIVVNDVSFYRHSFVFRVGQGAAQDIHYLLVGAEGIDTALDEMIDWIAENEPDLIINDQVHEAYLEAMKERNADPTDYNSDESQDAMQEAEVDTTSGGNAGDHIDSDSWNIVVEDPTDDVLQKFGHERQNPSSKKTAPRARDEDNAVAKYREFNSFDPKELVYEPMFAMPTRVTLLGDAVSIQYRSRKVIPDNGVRPRGWIYYTHDHSPGCFTYGTDGELDIEVPSFIVKADALSLLGECIGFSWKNDEGDGEGVAKTPYPELYATPCGRALLVIQNKRKVLAMSWGGRLGVEDRGIVG